MNNKEFIAELSKRNGFTLDNTQRLVKSVIDRMTMGFENGENVFVSGFGTFELKKRQERTMINPSTGQKMLVPPKIVLNFRPVQSIKQKLKKGDAGND
jgi:DNA-binding protein HU-beta